ncbi:MAG: DUF1963 domain-containing protein [Caulobacterales bacterium]|nr:DUF1963 domain-containing protein [Caulobacterales bacterium]MCA0372427.1 DUF1963 domain-containing protein [Pseudomonadota bacterium]
MGDFDKYGFQNKNQLIQSLKVTNLDNKTIGQLVEVSKNCIWLETHLVDEDEIPLGETKIGGLPDLPIDIKWPIKSASIESENYHKELEHDISDAFNEMMKLIPSDQVNLFRESHNNNQARPKSGYPLSFVAQINFAKIIDNNLDEDFPKSGRLWIFYDNVEQPWGYDNVHTQGASVIFSESENLERKLPPSDDEFFNNYCKFKPLKIIQHQCITPIPYYYPDFCSLNIDESQGEAYWDWWMEDEEVYSSENGTNYRCHRIGGWPTPIQGDMQTICEVVSQGYYTGDSIGYKKAKEDGANKHADQWVLLAQIGTDEKADILWGDSGQIYIWIKREDLKNRHFDKARIQLQCY